MGQIDLFRFASSFQFHHNLVSATIRCDPGRSHCKYKHPVKSVRVIIAGHLLSDVPVGTKNRILKQAGLKK